jgi:hypothetical protein
LEGMVKIMNGIGIRILDIGNKKKFMKIGKQKK